MSRHVRAGLLWVGLLVAAAAPVGAQRAGAPKLGVDGLVLFRGEGSVAVLAVATSAWRAVSTRSEELLGDFQYLPEYASARAQGQIFERLAADPGRWPGLAGVEEGDGRRRFVAVPWSFGPGCAEEGWQNPEWVPAGDTVTFLLQPTRSREAGDEGLPVFDVLGWHQPYPVGELIPFWRKTPAVNPEWLTAEAFYGLLTVMPSEAAFRSDPERAMAPALEWVSAAPGRASAFPIPEILQGWQRVMREAGEEDIR